MIQWTPETIDRLKSLWEIGATASMIAIELGTTRSAILGKVHRLNLPGRVHYIAAKRIEDKRERAHAKKQRIMADIAPKPLPARKKNPARVRIICAADGKREMQTVGRPMLGAPRSWCRWPIDGQVPRLCCSAPVVDDHSWCRAHAGIVYVRPRGHVLRSNGGTTISGMRAAE